MKKILPILLALAAVAAGCTGRQERSRNADKYDEWKASLADSVASLQQTVKLTEDSLATAYSTVDSMLSLFTFVDNPREVEGYTILKAARDHYPLTRTGLTARIAKSEGIEESGFRFIANNGPDGGQTIYHTHFHLIGGSPLGEALLPPESINAPDDHPLSKVPSKGNEPVKPIVLPDPPGVAHL